MPSPYRESNDTPPTPAGELRWRRSAGSGARWAEMLLVGNVALFTGTWVLPAASSVPGAVAWFVTSAAAVAATWVATASTRGVGRRGWLLRSATALFLTVAGLLQLGLHVPVAGYISGALFVVASAAHVRSFAASPGTPRRRRWLQWTLAASISGALLAGLFPRWQSAPPWRFVSLLVLLLGVVAFDIVRRTTLVDEHHWWFDTEMEAPGEWVALLVHRDNQAEVLCVDETLGWFRSDDEATAWLEDNGYVPAERALAEHLVDSVPPDVLPLARRRKRLRAAATAKEPRVRVASDASDRTAHDAAEETADELEDSTALDEPEPGHAFAIRDPHDPHA